MWRRKSRTPRTPRTPRKWADDPELGYFAEMIVRAIVDDYGITRVDIREVTQLEYMDAIRVRQWNHRVHIIRTIDLMRKIDATAKRRGLGWSTISSTA